MTLNVLMLSRGSTNNVQSNKLLQNAQTVRLFNRSVRLKYITWLKLFLVTMSVLPRPQNTGEQHTGRTVSWETEGLVKTVKYHSQIYACGVVPPGRGIK